MKVVKAQFKYLSHILKCTERAMLDCTDEQAKQFGSDMNSKFLVPVIQNMMKQDENIDYNLLQQMI